MAYTNVPTCERPSAGQYSPGRLSCSLVVSPRSTAHGRGGGEEEGEEWLEVGVRSE